MKLVEKIREGIRVKEIYAIPRTPYQRMLDCREVVEKTKRELRIKYRTLDPIDLAKSIGKSWR